MERFETKYDLLNQVYQDTRLRRTTKALMQYLVAKSDELSCHPSVATIAAAIRMSERTVQRHMRQLEQYGYIIRKSRYYRDEQLTNQYEFLLDVIDEAEQAEAGARSNPLKEQAEQFCNDNNDFSKMEYIKRLTKTGLSNKECLVLIYFIHKANKNGIAYGNGKTIAKELHMSLRLLWRVILNLRLGGYLKLKNRGAHVIVKMMPVNEKINNYTEVKKDSDDNKESNEYTGEEKKVLYPELEKVCYDNKNDEYHGADAHYQNHYPKRKIKGKWKLFFQKGWSMIQRILLHFLS